MLARVGAHGLVLWLLVSVAAQAETFLARPTAEDIEKALDPATQPPAGPRTRGLMLNARPNERAEAAKASVSLPIQFAFNSAELSPTARGNLDLLGTALASPKFEGMKFSVVGHTDASGSDRYNEQLSRRRAETVARYLAANFPVQPSRLQVSGMGERKLLRPEAPEDPINRRVEVVNEGRAP